MPGKNKFHISLKISEGISQPAESWDALLPDNHHLLSRHLSAFEKSEIEDIQNNYVQVFLNNELIGLVYMQKFWFSHKHINFSDSQNLLSKFIKIILPKKLQLLVCGHLFRINFPGFYFKNPSHQNLLFDVISIFIKQQRKKPYGVMIKDCNERLTQQSCRLSGYQFFNGDVTMEINRKESWHSFEDYLYDLKKDYLKRAKKIMRAFEPVETKQLSASEILSAGGLINKLYWNVVNKQMICLGTVNASYFYQLKTDLADNFEFHALYVNGTITGFYTFIFYAGEMETHYIGLDYEANKKYKLYFNILFAGVQKMIERQDMKMELGRTAKEAKANLGAVPKQIFNYIKISNPVIKVILNYFLKKFNRAEDKLSLNRNPLK